MRESRFIHLLTLLLLCPTVALAQDDEAEGEGDESAEAVDDGPMFEENTEDPDTWERAPDHAEPPPKKEVAPVEESPPGDGKRFDVGLQVSWGAPASKPQKFTNDAWNLGFGLRLAYTDDGQILFPNVRAGLMYSYYLGDTDTNAQLVAAELAFDWWVVEHFVIRPTIDLGAVIVMGGDVAAVRDETTSGGFYFGPGVAVMYPMELMYLGAEVRGVIVSNNLQSSANVAVNVGARF